MLVGFLSFALDPAGRAAQLVLDRRAPSYPFTMQNLEHLAFVVGLTLALVRRRVAGWEMSLLSRRWLPSEGRSILRPGELAGVRQGLIGWFDSEHGFLPSLMHLTILQVQVSQSVDQAAGALTSGLELLTHRVDLRYSWLRYLAWLIPALGFIGTVMGIAQALQGLGTATPDMQAITGALSFAFDTTTVALVESAVLVMAMNDAQAAEERALNAAGEYCLRNLINRLHNPRD
jgi:biopolymer transport protein ExbB/TolQ